MSIGNPNGQPKGDFAGLVSDLMRHKHAEKGAKGVNGDATPSKSSIGLAVSRHLPATGFKKNTEENREKNEGRQGTGVERQESGWSSSSSLPSDAEGRTDSRSQQQKEDEQEGAEGRGPGRHESFIPDGHDDQRPIHDSPVEELSSYPSVPQPRANGQREGSGTSERMIRIDDSAKGSRDRERERDETELMSRSPSAKRQLTDELGRSPVENPGMKEEEVPGPRNEIALGPRITHIHYHEEREPTVDGIHHGPILKVTSDGEAELPPGQTPQASRRPSASQEYRSTSSNDLHAYENGMGNTISDGTWRNALQSSRQKKKGKTPASSRFSSFREDGITTGESDAEGNHGDNEAPDTPTDAAQKRWSMLRHRVLPSKTSVNGPTPNKVSALAPTVIASVPVTTELFAGQLPVMILKTWIDRDENGKKAVPVLLGNLRFRVGDSVGLKQGKATGKEMFKVECEYGDGAVKWVIYRELRDFLSLHAHYKAANFGTSVAGLRSTRHVEIPDFPRMSVPFFNKFDKQAHGKEKERESKEAKETKEQMKISKNMGKAEYAQASRDALQRYLVDLIRAVIFRPESNRLCKFFELSALTLSLAPRGGFQGKAGFLMIPGSNASRRANQPGLMPASWKASREPKWFIVRDSYCVATDGPETTDLYEVFLFDPDFTIIRPKRYYRTGMGILHPHKKDREDDEIANHVDADNPFTKEVMIASGEGKGSKAQNLQDETEHEASQHTFYIVNSQIKLKLVAKNARQMHQYIVSMERIAAQCAWTKKNRFDSFAPLRVNVAAQWLVDGRDYFWNLSRAINMAKDRIYIHDWWISPELYLRRPGNERYRLDNLLKRKAEEGVKIFIIIYNEVSDKTTPVDSTYTKRSLMNLHPNILVQRSPSHFQTGTFYWSHHEKLCVIDETIAFMGGLDLCYGRWDTPQHVLLDEKHTADDGPDGPVWRGKDYSNERVMEYANLDKPFEDMFDRTKIPRMPWHDTALQIVGQPARDLCRHFVQRWNLLIRTKNHTRRMPFLLPPADFTDRELQDLKLQGTCEVQICRSVGPWSMGTQTKIEHSIQNAYCKSIETSEHFVYIENQFFITSTVVDGVRVENGIGDALVNRIIRAHKESDAWRACIVIPLLPGYTYPLDSNEASSVRLILECQNRTIARGTSSIFSRLRKEGIDPDDYITFFSLRGWGKFDSGVLTTEQVYIHGKTMIVDDRLVLTGSANINERSQRGDRDSELLAVVRDTDMIDGTMAGRPYKVGRYAHTLRVRLMREHIGVDVDGIDEEQLMSREPMADADDIETWDPDHEQQSDDDDRGGTTQIKRRLATDRMIGTFQNGVSSVTKGMSENAISNVKRAADKVLHPIAVAKSGETVALNDGGANPSEREDFNPHGKIDKGFASSMVPTLEEKTIYERRPDQSHANGKPLFDHIDERGEDGQVGQAKSGKGDDEPGEAEVPTETKKSGLIVDSDGAKVSGVPRLRGKVSDTELYGTPANVPGDNDKIPVHDTDRTVENEDEEAIDEMNAAVKARKTLRKHLSAKVQMSPWSMATPTPQINPARFHDPLDGSFWKDVWVASAVHNTEIFRKVFRCIPDDLVTSWAQYKAFANHAEKFNKAPEEVAANGQDEPVKVTHDGPGTHGAGGGGSGGGQIGSHGDESSGSKAETSDADVVDGKPRDVPHPHHPHVSRPGHHSEGSKSSFRGGESKRETEREKKASGPDEGWAEWEKEEMELLLNEVKGHLVIYPNRFLEGEDLANNFLFNSDKILPLPIFD
ncbi:phospholipase D [Cryptococcus wingfieldii CBS 7118]|uniref:Phospholipase n=1 Tax=Cryptococcus wingfieldii CBS 7118 TaxID=1295528 RepID=A0A1E3J7G8_9TREE|nr:phospholipase D [Cryptococcus wingfieldii CBS 7118]ODN95881.1 phospholipase D [Cryptococcus wingfieldii CBS 7118]